MNVGAFSGGQFYREVIFPRNTNFPGEVNIPGRSTFPSSQFSLEGNFSGKSYFLVDHFSQSHNELSTGFG